MVIAIWHPFFNVHVKKKAMDNKEKHTGGELTNKEVEQELNREGAPDTSGRNYVGMQDTGDARVRDADHAIRHKDDTATGKEPEGNE